MMVILRHAYPTVSRRLAFQIIKGNSTMCRSNSIIIALASAIFSQHSSFFSCTLEWCPLATVRLISSTFPRLPSTRLPVTRRRHRREPYRCRPSSRTCSLMQDAGTGRVFLCITVWFYSQESVCNASIL